MNSSPQDGDHQHQIRALLTEYIQLYTAHDDRLSAHFSDSFSGYTSDAEALVKDPQEWLRITRQNASLMPQDGWQLEWLNLSLQDIRDDVVLATTLLRTHLPQEDGPPSDAEVRLVLIFRCENGVWKIVHSSFSHLGHSTPPALSEALAHLKEQNQTLQTLLEEHIQTLQKKETLYRQLTEDTCDVLWKTDSQLRLTYISPADERLRGFKAEEVLGRHIFEMFTEEGIAIVQQKIQARALADVDHTTTDFSMFEVQHRCQDGRLIWGEVLAKPDRNAQGAIIGYHGITRETTQRKLLQDQVHDLAFYDPLTQLANRRLLIDHLTQALLSCQRQRSQGAVLFLDLDNFKSLNDAHGHGAGDLLLIEAAQRLKACVRAIDTVARFGGDEFVVLLGVLSSECSEAVTQAGAIAEKIRASLAQPYQITVSPANQPSTAVEHRCSASIGVVLFDGHDTTPSEIIDQADAVMYQAKKEGRNRVCFHTEGARTTETKRGG